jgi:hypothetical protein
MIDAAGPPSRPVTPNVSPEHYPPYLLGLMADLGNALPMNVFKADRVIPNTWSPAFAEQCHRVCRALLERLHGWQAALQRVYPVRGGWLETGTRREGHLAAFAGPHLAPDSPAIPEACSPEPLLASDPCPGCGCHVFARSVASGELSCLNGGCGAVYNPLTDHWDLEDEMEPEATAAPEPIPGVSPTEGPTWPAPDEVRGAPVTPEADPVARTPVDGGDPEQPAGNDQHDILRRVKALRGMGASLRAIAGTFNEEGVPTLSGNGRWDSGTLSRLLRPSGRVTHGPERDDDPPPAA